MRIEWINPEALVRPSEGGLSRRSFIKAGALATSGLVLGFFMPGANKFALAAGRTIASGLIHSIRMIDLLRPKSSPRP